MAKCSQIVTLFYSFFRKKVWQFEVLDYNWVSQNHCSWYKTPHFGNQKTEKTLYLKVRPDILIIALVNIEVEWEMQKILFGIWSTTSKDPADLAKIVIRKRLNELQENLARIRRTIVTFKTLMRNIFETQVLVDLQQLLQQLWHPLESLKWAKGKEFNIFKPRHTVFKNGNFNQK